MFAPHISQIVVNADDLGANRVVNDRIFDAIQEGLVTSASVMANGEGFQDVCDRFRTFPNASLGVHLNLTGGRPLSNPENLGGLVEPNGEFRENIRGVASLRRLRSAMYEELRLQVARVQSAGISISHFDSHQHIHTIPVITPIVKQLQREFGVYRLRRSRNFYPVKKPPGALRVLQKRLFNFWLSFWPNTRLTDGFGDARDFLENAASIPRRWNAIEMETHPGGPRGADEMQALRRWLAMDPTVRQRLVNYFAI